MRTARWVAVLVSVAAVGGCSGPATGTAVTTPLAPRLSPAVAVSRDVSGIPACEVLTASQLTGLELDPSTQVPGALATLDGCRWDGRNGSYGLSLTIDTSAERGGLENLYVKKMGYSVFEPMVIDGYPAVRAELGTTDSCTIALGLSDTQLIAFQAGPPRPGLEDTCAAARQALSAALTNIPPQG